MASQEHVRKIADAYVRRLAESIKVQQVILTGSRARGTYLEDSDVDLIVVSDDFSRMVLPQRLVFLQRFWKSKIPLEAFGYTTAEFQKLKQASTYVKDAVRHGTVLFDSHRPIAESKKGSLPRLKLFAREKNDRF